MISEINLHFKNSQQVTIQLVQHSSVTVDFTIPFTVQDREAIRHYLEVYAAQYVMDIDDQEAKRVTAQLPQWGQSLFDAVFNNAAAKQLFSQFINTSSDKYLLSITAQQPEILSLPWELLHDAGQFLFALQPSITILRRIPAKTTLPVYKPKSQLHILFLISRPQDESFINPRTDAQAVLKVIENYPAISVEFLQPASLENLWQRLQNSELPPVDVIHFDGHGYFDKTGDLAHTTIRQLSGLSRDLRKQLRNLKIDANSGYLLFEKANKYGKKGRDKFYVPTSWLNHILSESKVRLMVLSACQSAMVVHDDEETEEEPIGSIAVGLVATSVPSVLAMSYSVMVRATELLFGTFYMDIAAGNSVGMALDKARHALLQDRKRRDLQRGQERVEIEVSDWFLPTLYQANQDTVLVSRMTQELPKSHKHNLSALPDAGFWGRRRELWQIENWFIDGIRRVVISGFSGQGKTFLAQELGRWLLQKAKFDAVVFVDYSGYQGQDAVQWAVTSLSSVLEQSLADVAAANTVFQTNRILLILDNLEIYVTEKQDTLQELLTVAHKWSSLGDTRVLITTRPVELGHEAYQERDDNFRQLVLDGLEKEDALYYFEQLLVLSDNPVRLQRDELLRWFAKVQFHPLSIGLLARSLETEDLANLEARLNQLMLELPDNPVEATLQLVIEQLDDESRRLLPRLGVFQGGAFEENLLAITNISNEQWYKLFSILEQIGLIQSEHIHGIRVLYFKFHPNFASFLWAYLSSEEQAKLLALHQHRYYLFSGGLYQEDRIFPSMVRTIAKKELPNLLYAVYRALNIGEEWSVIFAEHVNKFLRNFGFNNDHALLCQYIEQATNNKIGSQKWFLAHINIVEQLLKEGYYHKAVQYLHDILQKLGKQLSYERCDALEMLGSCYFTHLSNTDLAFTVFQTGLVEAEKLLELEFIKKEKDKFKINSLKLKVRNFQSHLSNVLVEMGNYESAKTGYERTLVLDEELEDIRGTAVDKSQLATLLMRQGNLKKAERLFQEALVIFKKLHEPELEAMNLYILGLLYEEAKEFEEAEKVYRKSAQIRENLGIICGQNGAIANWNALACLTESLGKDKESEAWYRKAIEHGKSGKDMVIVSLLMNNLANLLQNNPNRLPEAQQLAEQALAIDPAVAKIWKTYHILSEIADKQGNAQEAKKYRRLAREAKANFAGTWYELKQYAPLILMSVQAVESAEIRKELEGALSQAPKTERQNLIATIQQILAGERNVDKLCEPLDFYDAPIITAILEGIANPDSLKWFEDV